jgi:ADP-ribose pyrophosphatase
VSFHGGTEEEHLRGLGFTPFAETDPLGRELKNPYAATGRSGAFGGWTGSDRWFGEIAMADAVVFCTFSGTRHLLMIRRGDGLGYALPGGKVERGETAVMAASRELAGETGLLLYETSEGEFGPEITSVLAPWADLGKRHVPDPRETDDAWAVSTPIRFDLGEFHYSDGLPKVRGGDDAASAIWLPATDYATLEYYVREQDAEIFPAHRDLLTEVLG